MNEEQDDYTPEEFYDEFLKDAENQETKRKKYLTQRIGKKELYHLVSKQCRYPKHEVQDVLEAFWAVLNVQLEQGREFDFGGIFTAKMYRPFPRRIYDYNNQNFKISSGRPRLKLVPTDAYAKYLWRAVHCPVNYMPMERIRHQEKTKEEFTEIYEKAYKLWYDEDQRRQAKAKAENPTDLSGTENKQ